MQYITAETAWGVGDVIVAAAAAAAAAIAVTKVPRAVTKCGVGDDLCRTVLVVYIDEVAFM